MVILRSMEKIGFPHQVQPPPGDIVQGKFSGTFSFMISTSASKSELEAKLSSMTDVEEASVTSKLPEEDPPQALNGDAPRAGRPASPPAGEAAACTPAISKTVRIDTKYLDDFMDHVGELYILEGYIERDRGLQSNGPLKTVLGRMRYYLRQLKEKTIEVRLVPFESISHEFHRTVREANRVCNKKVQLTIRGAEAKVDRSILEEIITPISHILRNAVDHGIESPEERLKAGKEPKGTLQISVRRSGDSVGVEIEDDGRGIDPADIRQVAFQKGYITREQFEKLSDREALFLITTPGFSLSDSVSEISGRGVGMDVVSTKIEALGGKLDIDSKPGRFTKIVLRLPMTVAMIHAFLVKAGTQVFAIPVNRIERTTEVELSRISFSQGRPVLVNDHEVTEIFRLGELFHEESRMPSTGMLPMITYSARGRRVGLLVDSILEEREILVKPLKSPLELMSEYTGSTILEDGSIALILDVENIV